MKTFKSKATQEAEQRIKKNQKTEKENISMKTKLKTTFKYLLTVTLTLAGVFAGYSLYMKGYETGKHDQKSVNAEVVRQVAQLKANEQ